MTDVISNEMTDAGSCSCPVEVAQTTAIMAQWTAEGMDGVRATCIEAHVQRMLAAVDPTAVHVGGNTPIRDHEILANHAWVQTKSAWFYAAGSPTADYVGYSPVKWSAARDPKRPRFQLDLVALAVLRPGGVSSRWTANQTLELSFQVESTWLVPASVLEELTAHAMGGVARSYILTAALDPYRLDQEHPLTRERLLELVAENRIAS